MSGYVVADNEQLVVQKVGTNVQYKVTEIKSGHRYKLINIFGAISTPFSITLFYIQNSWD